MAEETSADDGGHGDVPDGTANGSGRDDLLKTAATIGIIVVGAALIEVGLIPGMIIGVAAAYAPKYLPKVGEQLQPMFKCAVRGAYKLSRKAKEAVAEVHGEDTKAPTSESPSEGPA
jgi:hypothetical protein